MARNNRSKHLMKLVIALGISVVAYLLTTVILNAMGNDASRAMRDYYIAYNWSPMVISFLCYAIWQLSNTFRKKSIDDSKHKKGKVAATVISVAACIVAEIVLLGITGIEFMTWVIISAVIYSIVSIINTFCFGAR